MSTAVSAEVVRHRPLYITHLRHDPWDNGEVAPFATIVVLHPSPESDVFIGVARCSQGEQFVKRIGRNIAEGRARACLTHHVRWARQHPSEQLPKIIDALKKLEDDSFGESYDGAFDLFYTFCVQFGICTHAMHHT